MALMTCHECKAQVSSEATTCPKCGARVRSKQNGVLAIVGAAIGAALMGMRPIGGIFSIGLDTNTSRTLRLSRSILKNAIRQL